MNATDQNIKSYVPESAALEGKDENGARICVEDCAVLDTSRDLRILQARGMDLLPDTPFATAVGMSEAERQELCDKLGTHTRFLMSVGKRPLLILADWLKTTGIILAILPHTTVDAARKVLPMMGRTDIALPEGEPARQTAKQCRVAQAVLTDLFRYLDCLFSTGISPSHFLLSTATFAGCRMEIEPSFFRDISEEPLGDRASALMLCVLLYVRSMAGTAKHEKTPKCRLSIAYSYPAAGSYRPPEPTFLDSPCFSGAGIERDGARFSLLFPSAAGLLLNAPSDSPAPRIILEIVED